MEHSSLPKIEVSLANTVLSKNKGIYFWFTNDNDRLIYIGIALGVGGLKRRVINQHLNPLYLEFRSEKHTEKDQFQSINAICRVNKDGKDLRGIDKSAFRKSIGRKLKLKPGIDTLKYITENLYLKVFESEDMDKIKALEIELIKEYKPEFNTSHKPK